MRVFFFVRLFTINRHPLPKVHTLRHMVRAAAPPPDPPTKSAYAPPYVEHHQRREPVTHQEALTQAQLTGQAIEKTSNGWQLVDSNKTKFVPAELEPNWFPNHRAR